VNEIFSTGSGPDAWTDCDEPPWMGGVVQPSWPVQPVVLPIGFELFYLTYLEPWQRFAEVVLADSGAAYQVCHEVFLYVAVGWHEFQGERPVEAWELLRAAVAYEKSRAVASPSFFWKMTFGHAMASSRADLAGEEGPVMNAVSKLPPRQFDVIVLKHFMKRSRAEIAWLLGCTPSTVDYHHREARTRLKALLTADHDEGETA